MIFASYWAGIDPRLNQFLTVVSPSPIARASPAAEPQISIRVFLSMRHNMNCQSAQVNTLCVTSAVKGDFMDMHTRLRDAREKAGYADAASAARRFGWGQTTYRSHENGQRGYKLDKAIDYGRAFRVSPEWLLFGKGDNGKRPVPLVGYVGAGAEMFSYDDGGALDEIDPPPGVGPSAVAVMVRGDSMFPRYMSGDILIYDRHTMLSDADGQECVVSLLDGRKFVKMVRVDGRGDVTLESWNAPPLRQVHVEWVAKIIWVKRSGG